MRIAEITRNTKETQITVKLDLDGKGVHNIDTGIGFFDHMLTALCVHGGFDMDVSVKGDLYVDGHHSVEDTGIVLGMAFKQAVGDMKGIARYGTSFIPMDESLASAALISATDLSLFLNAASMTPEQANSITALPKSS